MKKFLAIAIAMMFAGSTGVVFAQAKKDEPKKAEAKKEEAKKDKK